MAPTSNTPKIQKHDGPPHSNARGYQIPDITFKSPENRRMKILCIGAGVSGIMMAYRLQKNCQNYELKIFEKNPDIGGTWLENRYPLAASDVPAHAYTYPWALNPDWPRYFARSPEIWEYLDRVCATFNLRQYMTFNTAVTGCYWNDENGYWLVQLKETNAAGETVREFEETAEVILHATGILNNFKFPEIEGIKKFKGKVIHTARWPENYQAEAWKDESVAIIGSGASSIQTVPGMQPHVKHMDIFVRTPVWFIEIAGHTGTNRLYTKDEKETFNKDVDELVAHSKDIEDKVNALWTLFFTTSEDQEKAQAYYRERTKQFLKDERLVEGFSPKWSIGCRRVTPGDPYMLAIQEPNVDVHFTHVDAITEDGVVGGDGKERKCDTIVCATGFDVSYRPRFPIVGKNGVELANKWKQCPEAYLGITVPDMPNFYTFIGPTWPVENGSVMGPLHYVSLYVLQCIQKMQAEGIKSMCPKQDVTDAFNEHAQTFIKGTVWEEECRSWYKNNETGRVNAVWPGSSLHYIEVIDKPRYEDYNIEYTNKLNMWAFLGLGFTDAHRKSGSDLSPYMNRHTIDPKWYAEQTEEGKRLGEKGLLKKRKQREGGLLEDSDDDKPTVHHVEVKVPSGPDVPIERV